MAPEEPLIPQEMLDHIPSDIDFTMVNPPFYASSSEMLASAAMKSRPPNSACTGAEVEMIYPPPPTSNGSKHDPGGELGFTLRLLAQSSLPEVRHRVKWFTTMLGKLSTASALVENIRDVGCTNYAVTDFVQGSKTRRWGVAWSWLPFRPANNVARGTEAMGKALLPAKTETVFLIPNSTLGKGGDEIDHLMGTMDEIDWIWKREISIGVGRAAGNVWGRRARRSKQRGVAPDGRADPDAFVFKISVRASKGSSETELAPEIQVRWLKGDDAVIFESFCEMLRRHVQQPQQPQQL